MCKSRIESIGLYLPERRVSTAELIGRMEKKPDFDLEQITGIAERRVRSAEEDSFALARKAAEDCLKHSSIRAEDLEIVIFTSITRFRDGLTVHFEPTMSLQLKQALGASAAQNFDVSNACAGMLTGVYLLDNMIRAGVVKNGMVVSGECITPIAETAVREIRDPIDDQFASLTVGDSGAACILDNRGSAVEGIELIDFATAADRSMLCFGKPSDRGPGVAMYTKTREMHRNIKYLPYFLENLYQRNGQQLCPEAYDFIIAHQVSVGTIICYLQVLQAHYQTEEMPPALFSVHDCGNTSTTTHWVALYRALQEGKVPAGARVLFIGVASGINVGCMSARLGTLEVSHER